MDLGLLAVMKDGSSAFSEKNALASKEGRGGVSGKNVKKTAAIIWVVDAFFQTLDAAKRARTLAGWSFAKGRRHRDGFPVHSEGTRAAA
jgi:hypothetical protein